MLFGHLAVSALEHKYLKADLTPVMIAAVLPDAVDKVLHYTLHRAPTGRLWGHTLLGAGVSTAIVLLLYGRRRAASWALGYLSHLLCDMGSVVPWLYPWITYDFPPSHDFRTTLWMSLTNLTQLTLEILLTLWALIVMRSELHGALLAARKRTRMAHGRPRV